MNEKLAPFLILFAAVLWGTTGTAQTFAPEAAHPVAVGAARLAVGGVFLLILVFLTGGLSLKNWPLRATILAALSMALFQPLFFTAVTITGVAIGTVVAIGSAPVLSGFLEWLFLKRRPSRIWWSSTFLSILGCLMLFLNKDSVVVDPVGVLMALGAGLSFAVYAIVSRDLVGKFPSLSIVAVVFTLSAVFLAPFLFIFEISWMADVRGWSIVLYLGVMTTGVAYFLFGKGLIYVSSSTAVTLALAEPLTAALFGVFLLGENLNATSWMGMVLLMLGIGLLIGASRSSASKGENRAA
ncbi:EamA family transporter [Sutcliffiella horikoshii]|uniref:EamA family transporter n=1 Tax=Sutcliffiella horikoshii TaxID=79883 RepID=UPI00384A6600